VALGGYLLARGGYLMSRRGYLVARRRSPRRLPPALTAGFFGLATVGLAVLTRYHGGVPLIVPAGPGAYLSGALVTGALTAGYGAIAWRRHRVTSPSWER
jgi:hypothetical protein